MVTQRQTRRQRIHSLPHSHLTILQELTTICYMFPLHSGITNTSIETVKRINSKKR